MSFKNTNPEVFIIESLDFDDEKNDNYEGKMLSNILKLNNKKPIYYYIRTEQELNEIINEFEDSHYRYLHLSCHGSKNSMETTLDSISFDRLAEIIKPCLDNRRLFISACDMVDHPLAREIILGSDCYSLIGPYTRVALSTSAIFWSSFYHLMFSENESLMKEKEIRANLKALTNVFGIPINYFWPNNETKQKYSFRQIKPDKNYLMRAESGAYGIS